MRAELIIRLTPPPQQPQWFAIDDQQQTATGAGKLQEIPADKCDFDIKVLVPTEKVLLTQAQVPSRQHQQILQALPYQLEEKIIGDIDAQHFAIGKREDNGQIHAAVCHIEDMQQWLETLRQNSLEPSLLCPDVLALPWQTGHWSACACQGRVLVRTGQESGFSCEIENLPFYLEQISTGERPQQILWHVCKDSQAADGLSLTIAIKAVVHEQSLIELMASELRQHAPLNLLQGLFSRHRHLERIWQAARPSFLLLLLLIVTLFVSAISRVYQLDKQKTLLSQQIEAIYRQTFPQDKRIVDPRIQAQRHLKALREGNHRNSNTQLLDLLRRTSPVLASTSGLRLKRLTYHNEVLSLRLDIPTLAAIDGLKKKLLAQGAVDVRIIAATAEQGRVTATLELRPQNNRSGTSI